jgi:transketolase N-terminal domain/subunit
MSEKLFIINGIGHTEGALRALAKLPTILDRSMRRWGRIVHRTRLYGWENYVPERPGQVYIRTGRLGQGHELSFPAEAAARFRNVVPYVARVIGDSEGDGQAWMHKNRWWIARVAIEEEIPALLDDAEAEVEKEFRR